jgi:hypothetical protein
MELQINENSIPQYFLREQRKIAVTKDLLCKIRTIYYLEDS